MYGISGLNNQTTSLQNIYAPSAKTKTSTAKDDNNKVSFSEYLNSFVDGTEEATIPDKWRTDQPKNAIDIAVAYMQDHLGIDANKRTPTHEITEEQKEWLASRHDLSKLHEYSPVSAERQNFLADLVYLNVMSVDEAKNFGLVVFPGHTAVMQKADKPAFTLGAPQYTNFADVLASALSTQQDLISYIQNKANDPTRSEAKDFDYLESALKNADRQRKLYEMLLGLYK